MSLSSATGDPATNGSLRRGRSCAPVARQSGSGSAGFDRTRSESGRRRDPSSGAECGFSALIVRCRARASNPRSGTKALRVAGFSSLRRPVGAQLEHSSTPRSPAGWSRGATAMPVTRCRSLHDPQAAGRVRQGQAVQHGGAGVAQPPPRNRARHQERADEPGHQPDTRASPPGHVPAGSGHLRPPLRFLSRMNAGSRARGAAVSSRRQRSSRWRRALR
jgi:hypothetical protein